MLSVAEIINDADLAESFQVIRTTGSFVKGVWTSAAPTTLSLVGSVQPAGSTDINMVPEGDRVKGMVAVWCNDPLYTTSTDGSNTSDIIVWHGVQWRVLSVEPWNDAGYYHAVASRMKGA